MYHAKNAVCFNTKITAFLTYLELPRAVKMIVCPIKKNMRINLALFYLKSFLISSIPDNDLSS